MEIDNQPEFILTVQSTGRVHIASSEAEVWRKFDGECIMLDQLSFFNLEIELLLEGLKDAQNCSEYLFHCERGYGDTYTTQEQATLASTAFLARQSREMRSRNRHSQRHMTPDEARLLAETRKRQQQLENEKKKRLAAEEKEQREREKAVREREKEAERQRREEEKQRREQEKEVAKKNREVRRREEKAKNFMRKDVMSEMRKARTEAVSQVLQCFDEEEDQEELQQTALAAHALENVEGTGTEDLPSALEISELDTLLQEIPCVREHLCVDESSDVSRILDTVNCLHALRGLLHLSNNFKFEYFVNDILGNFGDFSDGTEVENTEDIEMKEAETLRAESECAVVSHDLDRNSGQENLDRAEPSVIVSESEAEVKSNHEIPSETIDCVSNETTEVMDVVSTSNADGIQKYENGEKNSGSEMVVASGSRKSKSLPGQVKPPVHQPVQNEVDLDRIQLNIVRVMLDDLHELLHLDDDDADSSKRDRSQCASKLPLNQLTWQELARMLIVASLHRELLRSEEEVLHAIRGSKHAHYKLSKNVIRYIRYRIATRSFSKSVDDFVIKNMETGGKERQKESITGDDEDYLLKYALPDSIESSGDDIDQDDAQLDFTTDGEVMSAVEEISENEEYSEEYRRCCKVWIRVAALSQAKNLMWDVDENVYPDYHTVIKHPMSLSRIACKLIKKSYGESNAESTSISTVEQADDSHTADDATHVIGTVAASFYRDMRQVVINCFVFNTEAIALVAQAQKVLQVLHRHMDRWVFDPNRPPLYACNDEHCLFSSVPIVLSATTYSSIKCGRCMGIYSLDCLHANRKEFTVVVPTEELVQQSHEEWVCMLCLREDSVVTDGLDGRERGFFSFDEWGTSALVPWTLNSRHNTEIANLAKSAPQLQCMLDALQVLSAPNLSPVLTKEHTHHTRSTWPEQVLVPWGMKDRLNVYAALCEVLKCHNESHDYLNNIYNECVKLSKMSIREPFHEAGFMEQVRTIAGDAGATLCRSLLDGVDEESAQELLKAKVIEGRCLVCKGSTYEDDYEGTVLLCDGCNAEAHLPCLKIDDIPSKEWFCPPCADRMSSRYDEDTAMEALFKDVDSYRSKDEELRLIDELAETRDGERASYGGKPETLCVYCGNSELELCSPLVYGQSRAEFNAYVAMNDAPKLDDFYSNKKGTSVKFRILLEEQKPPEPSMPYFPLVKDSSASKFKSRKSSLVHSPIVHELCALRMFKARMQRSKHAVRRRRKVIAERVASLSGMATQPLGYDDKGRSYWQFPNCNYLFISPARVLSQREPDRESLLKMIQNKGKKCRTGGDGDTQESLDRSPSGDWLVVSDMLVVARLIELLGRSHAEVALRKALWQRFSNEIYRCTQQLDHAEENKPEEAEEDREEAEEDRTESQAEDEEDEKSIVGSVSSMAESRRGGSSRIAALADSKVVSMQILKHKGVDVQRRYVIKNEKVFEDADNDEEDDSEEEEDETSYQEYFTFSRSSRYFAIGLLNASGKVVKLAKGSGVTVVFQIHREGMSQGLAYTPLEEPWNDGIYYFSTLNFKRSGKYTISFIAEGTMVANIDPIVHTVLVEAESITCGPTCALERLRASSYVTHADRMISTRRRELLSEMSRNENEFVAVKSALITLYLALPLGSLILGPEEEDRRADIFGSIAEATGWNNNLEQTWRGCVLEARSPTVLMECVLLLEFYISKSWLLPPANKLITALPNPHFAMRCVTNAAVALRIYCLDRCLAYDRVQNVPRGVRSAGDGNKATTVSGQGIAPPRKSRNNMAAKRSLVAGDRPDDSFGTLATRPRRAASVRARESLSASMRGQYEDSDDESFRGGRRLRERPVRPDWKCVSCSTMNEDRARSCIVCGSRKPPAGYAQETTRLSRAERMKRRRRYNESESSESEEDIEEEEDEEEEENGNEFEEESVDRERDLGLRKRQRVSYVEADEDDDVETTSFKSRSKKPRTEESDEPSENESVEMIDVDISSIIASKKSSLSEAQAETDVDLKLLLILEKLHNDPESEPFWYPVDTKVYTDYRSKVSEPMDLGTIARRVEVCFYNGDHEDFAKSVRQVWDNCQKYNQEGSPIYVSSQRLGEYFEQLYEDCVASIGQQDSAIDSDTCGEGRLTE